MDFIFEALELAGGDFFGPAAALLADLNLVWAGEFMGLDLTDAVLESQSEIIAAMQVLETALQFGFYPEGSEQVLIDGLENLDAYPQYGDYRPALEAVLEDIRSH